MRFTATFIFILFFAVANCQTFQAKWGEEIKTPKGFLSMKIIHVDNSGIYVAHKYSTTRGVLLGAYYANTFRLLKFDMNFNLLYEKDYEKELKDFEIKDISFLKDELYLFANKLKIKGNKLAVYGMKMDKNTGETKLPIKELCTFEFQAAFSIDNYAVNPSRDSSKWLIAGNLLVNGGSDLSLLVFNNNLELQISAQIDMKVNKENFFLSDIFILPGKKFFVFGSEFLGKDRKTVDNKKYIAKCYNEKGAPVAEVLFDLNEKYTMDFLVKLTDEGSVIFSGFYSNSFGDRKMDGIFFYHIDPVNGNVLQKGSQVLSSEDLNNAIKRQKLPEELKDVKTVNSSVVKPLGDIYQNIEIRDISFDSKENLLTILAEKTTVLIYMIYEMETDPKARREKMLKDPSKSWSIRNQTAGARYTLQDLVLIRAKTNDNSSPGIKFFPKKQIETHSGAGGAVIGASIKPSGYFSISESRPYFSLYNYFYTGGKQIFVFNDNKEEFNKDKTAKRIDEVGNGVTYGLVYDMSTGNYEKKEVLNNANEIMFMPRYGFVYDNSIYMPVRGLGKKDEIRIGKISFR